MPEQSDMAVEEETPRSMEKNGKKTTKLPIHDPSQGR